MKQNELAGKIRTVFKSWIALDFIRFTWRYRPRQDGMHYECTLDWHGRSLTLSIPAGMMTDVEVAVEAFKQQLRKQGYPGLILPGYLFEQRRNTANQTIPVCSKPLFL
ncbi:hypothetical protein [Taibaiella koreensis]|uniref:hypothetical protein n=1 Tax=Taibaiella koreensis TaxID=1268548 RepID=UPI0013C32B43|nr:hypothetical protein [Taibaiella koreensis]